MRDSQSLRAPKRSAGVGSWLAKPLAPEDVRPGDFVALLHITYELPSFLWCADSLLLPQNEPVRIQFLPEESGLPFKVRAVCLPFVFVKNPVGEHRSLDLRKYRLARLHREYAKIAWKTGKKSRAKVASL